MNHLNAQIYYNKLALKYDQVTKDAWSAPNRVEELTIQLANQNTTILDIGIGTGQSIRKVYQSEKFKTIEGIDVSDVMLKNCKESYPEVIVHCGDFLHFESFTLPHYDLVICCGTLEFIENLDEFFLRCQSLLSKNGDIVLTFEPRISGHPIQSESVSEVNSERQVNDAHLITYRRDVDHFYSVVRKYEFTVLFQSLFVSYRKLDVDVIYMLMHITNRVSPTE
ncbi:class I SAM-dependent methyltransferase [Dyadobacter sp. CY107]|uniref:class I SAM-dependent DNA methyltransferase n=1 Tax=Dyadobacter fanqingshengii TaxID=2906443 RepID=UPI001F41D700|nr:class I SAM-dependent methyltransferase [Dyadobacter fanqingshengii]MCF2502736.1 class I SAM-dependent methyltransferase [Dyadobacter fanqingshengii]